MDERKLILHGESKFHFFLATQGWWSHVSLDHFHSSLSDLGDGSWDVHHLLFLYLLQDVVYGNECTCATHTSTGYKEESVILWTQSQCLSLLPAVYYHGSPGGVVLSLHSPVEG